MLNSSASPAMSTSVLKALPGKLDIKRHSYSILQSAKTESQLYNGKQPSQQEGGAEIYLHARSLN